MMAIEQKAEKEQIGVNSERHVISYNNDYSIDSLEVLNVCNVYVYVFIILVRM
jgi:hypothetical protein